MHIHILNKLHELLNVTWLNKVLYCKCCICELESSMSPKHLEKALLTHQFASGKILLALLCRWTKKLTSNLDMELKSLFFSLRFSDLKT